MSIDRIRPGAPAGGKTPPPRKAPREEGPRDEVELGRSRAADGRFRVKRGDTRLKTIRETYGQDFAEGLPGNFPLALLRAATGLSLSQMLKNPEAVEKATENLKKETHLISLYEDGPGAGGGYPPVATADGHGAGGGYPPYASVDGPGAGGGYPPYLSVDARSAVSLAIADELELSAPERQALETASRIYRDPSAKSDDPLVREILSTYREPWQQISMPARILAVADAAAELGWEGVKADPERFDPAVLAAFEKSLR